MRANFTNDGFSQIDRYADDRDVGSRGCIGRSKRRVAIGDENMMAEITEKASNKTPDLA